MPRFIVLAVCLVVSLPAAMLAANAKASSQATNALRCKLISHGAHGENITHTEAVWKFNTTVSVCYNGRRIVRPGAACKVWHSDPVTIVNNGCGTQGYYYTWRGNPYGGYYSQAQATFQNCIIKFACLTNVTVTISIWVTGNGASISSVNSH